jgi:alpha,alpha-trehalase
MKRLLADLSAEFDRLRPQVIRPAEGFLKHDYLVPGGYYDQLWDWDGFFIGCHLAARSVDEARYLKGWVLNFLEAADAEGYVTGCLTPRGPRPLFGRFPLKPFLCQGAWFAAGRSGDFAWLRPVYDRLRRVVAYREETQLDRGTGLFFWDNAMQSGADNNVALTNDPNDRSAVLAADINAFQHREYLALAAVAEALGRPDDARGDRLKADALRQAMLERLWFGPEASFFNVRRDTGRPLRRVSYSNFAPLVENILPRAEGRRMIEAYLWNRDHLLADYGLRTLSRLDQDYNNAAVIVPYSNWRGPVWPIACFLYSLGLLNYGFEAQAAELAGTLGRLLLRDIRACGSMHENYHPDTGAPLAPTAEQSRGGVFAGFVGWNLLVENMLQGAVDGRWLRLEVPPSGTGPRSVG